MKSEMFLWNVLLDLLHLHISTKYNRPDAVKRNFPILHSVCPVLHLCSLRGSYLIFRMNSDGSGTSLMKIKKLIR